MQKLLNEIEMLAGADGFSFFAQRNLNDTDDEDDDEVTVFITTDREIEGGGRWATSFTLAPDHSPTTKAEAKRLYTEALA
ncbi:hypothetical protein [Rhizobium sp. Leaf383]|uniref:hypothetical protein n=1 Tax=Rhizobium sp. Leaf383 TaxID=1736357 RepID=UPI0007155F38|nr:hypothetical protein [Rhizobium sp. Leaf383]KQS84264.1 hypothetical protein ASG58_21070 [Rhizobium sp. Leaf383]